MKSQIYHHSQLQFSKYWLILLLLFFGNLGIAAGYHIAANIGDYELSGRVDAAVLAQADDAYADCTVLAHETASRGAVEVLVVKTQAGEKHLVVLERFVPFQNYHMTYIEAPLVPEGTVINSNGGFGGYNLTEMTAQCLWAKDAGHEGVKTVSIVLYDFGGDYSMNISSVEGSFEYGTLTSVPFIIFIVLVIVEVVAYFVIKKIRGDIS